MTFFTISTPRPQKKASPTCSTYLKPSYVLKVDSDGRRYLFKEKDIDIFSEVQMFKDDCSIYNIIRRYELGDTSVLNRVSSVYADTLGQPKTLQDALNLALNLKNKFNSLKPEVQSAFGSDFNRFLSSVADGSITDILSKFENQNKEVPPNA